MSDINAMIVGLKRISTDYSEGIMTRYGSGDKDDASGQIPFEYSPLTNDEYETMMRYRVQPAAMVGGKYDWRRHVKPKSGHGHGHGHKRDHDEQCQCGKKHDGHRQGWR